MATAGALAPPPERDLLRRIGARDEEAVAELYDRVSATLFGLVCGILGNRSEAEDVLQDVFLQVWNRAEAYDPAFGSPLGWLARIARNRAIDRYRALRVRARLSDTSLESVAESATSRPDDDPQRLAEVADTRLRVSRALNVLTPEQRLLIEHAFFDGLTHSELAERFGLPLGTVKTRIRAGVHALRQDLSDGEGPGEAQAPRR